MSKISIIIPSLDGYRGGNVDRLIADLKKQTLQDFDVQIVKGVFPNGKARNVGAKDAKGEILVFIDDDVKIGSNNLIEKLIEPFFKNSSIGLVGPSFSIPPDSNPFQKCLAKQLSRAEFMPQDDMLETDMVTHACMAIPAKVFWQIGGENEKLIRGTDPDLRYRLRNAGFKVMGRKGIIVYHGVPDNLYEFIKKSLLSGRDSAFSFRLYPSLIYDTSSKPRFEKSQITNKGLGFRVIRAIFRLLQDILTFKVLLFIHHIFYALGYLWGLFRYK